MEFFRWILIITGAVLLAVAYFMGNHKTNHKRSKLRKRERLSRKVERAAVDPSVDPSVGDFLAPVEDPLYENATAEATGERDHYQIDDIDSQLDNDQFGSSFAESESGSGVTPEHANNYINDDFEDIDLALDDRTDHSVDRVTSFAGAVKAVNAEEEIASMSGSEQSFAEEFEIYNEPMRPEVFEEKLVTVNVVASSGRRFYGNDLKALFDKHGYSHGRMSLYHCSLDGDKVFSVANMVKPGTFDEDQMRTFETPGITLFMRLPIELDSDVAFDFLIREAKELADELDGQLRDGNRNPLSEQTIKHMREEMQQYVFRSKSNLQPEA